MALISVYIRTGVLAQQKIIQKKKKKNLQGKAGIRQQEKLAENRSRSIRTNTIRACY